MASSHMPTAMSQRDVRQQAAAWLEKDPDESTRARLRHLLQQDDEQALQQAFSQRLAFGTAGLRGLMGVGPNNMNVSGAGRYKRSKDGDTAPSATRHP